MCAKGCSSVLQQGKEAARAGDPSSDSSCTTFPLGKRRQNFAPDSAGIGAVSAFSEGAGFPLGCCQPMRRAGATGLLAHSTLRAGFSKGLLCCHGARGSCWVEEGLMATSAAPGEAPCFRTQVYRPYLPFTLSHPKPINGFPLSP